MSVDALTILIWFGWLWMGCGLIITVFCLVALAIPHRLAKARLGYPPPPPRRADNSGHDNDNVIPLRRRAIGPRPL